MSALARDDRRHDIHSILRRTMLTAFIMALAPGIATAQDRPDRPQATLTAADLKALDRYFDDIDVNHDQRLSKLEMTTYGVSRRLGVSVREKTWKRMDKDRNGRISRDEFHAHGLKYKDGGARR